MIFTSIIMILSFLFTFLNHPLSMGLTLLVQTIIISIFVGFFTFSFWFSYILFLIFLGGLLVLFIYVASLASNEKFSFSLSTMSIMTTFLVIMMTLYMSLDLILIPNLSNLSTSSIFPLISTQFFMSWIFNYPSVYFTIMIILYLLLTLIVVVKITNLVKSPLRLMN
uniref:NADH dehydrogenase subunit 6 n=1 Tax=Esanthelphusa keyini (nom. nud.) TaxID=2907795 RepID=UPI001EDD2F27|nr:NADH dehydrogenase subunit 6 [Esanthelphusa keyini (nom. nud.)]UIB42750.1 NADH dehydrogenase subunit 6 [Esanthelphusa keyini (nom. nud.)]